MYQILFQLENDTYAYQNFATALRLMEVLAVAAASEKGRLETDKRTVLDQWRVAIKGLFVQAGVCAAACNGEDGAGTAVRRSRLRKGRPALALRQEVSF